MLQTKIFKINTKDVRYDQSDQFNLFVKDHPPTGVNGMKVLPEYVILTYENGEVMSENEKISHLVSELNTLLGNQIDEVRQYYDGLKMLDHVPFDTRYYDWKKIRESLIPMKNNCELTAHKIDVIIETLKSFNTVVEVKHPNLVEIPEDKSVKSPIRPKK